MTERLVTIIWILLLNFCDISTGKRVHFKIVVPKFYKHHTHTNIIFVHAKPKHHHSHHPKLCHHKPVYQTSVHDTLYGFHGVTSPKPVIAKPIVEVNKHSHHPKEQTEKKHHTYDFYEDEEHEEEPIDHSFQKTIKQHKYKDVTDFKKVHKKEEYDFKKGNNEEHHEDKKFDFNHKKGAHLKGLHDHKGHFVKDHTKSLSSNYIHDPNLEAYSESSSNGEDSAYHDVTAGISDENADNHKDFDYAVAGRLEGNTDPEQYVYDSETFLKDVIPSDEESNHAISSPLVNATNSSENENDNTNLAEGQYYEINEADSPSEVEEEEDTDSGQNEEDNHRYEVTEIYSEEDDNNLSPSQQETISRPNTLDVKKREKKLKTSRYQPPDSRELTKEYDAVKNGVQQAEKEASAKGNTIRNEGKGSKEEVANKLDRSKQEQDFFDWVTSNGPLELGYPKEFNPPLIHITTNSPQDGVPVYYGYQGIDEPIPPHLSEHFVNPTLIHSDMLTRHQSNEDENLSSDNDSAERRQISEKYNDFHGGSGDTLKSLPRKRPGHRNCCMSSKRSESKRPKRTQSSNRSFTIEVTENPKKRACEEEKVPLSKTDDSQNEQSQESNYRIKSRS